MKKVLSVALAAALAVGMSATAFAAYPDDFAFTGGQTLETAWLAQHNNTTNIGIINPDADAVYLDLPNTLFGGTGGTTTTTPADDLQVNNTALGALLDQMVDDYTLANTATPPTFANGNTFAPGTDDTAAKAIYASAIAGNNLDALQTALTGITNGASSTNAQATLAEAVGTSKLSALASATNGTQVRAALNALQASPALYTIVSTRTANTPPNTATSWDIEIKAPVTTTTGANITSSVISKHKVEVKYQAKAGSKAIKDVTLDKSKGRIKIAFAKELISVDDVDFELDIYLKTKDNNFRDEKVTLYGTMENQNSDIDGDWDSIDLSDGSTLESSEFIRKLEIEAGNGLFVYANIPANKTFYAYTNMDVTSADDDVMTANPAIDTVLNFKTNLKSGVVKLEGYGNGFVYDGNLNYLGKTTDELALATKYYIATEQLDVDDDDDDTEPTEDDDDFDDDDDDTAGSGSGNANVNPDTGANGLVNVAVVGALVSLAAIGAVSRKK